MDQGVRYVVQGNGSGPALAIMDALEKHNARNKGKEVVYLNYAAVDPDLTNSKCSYWHFRLDADTSMKMEALTTFMKDDARGQEGLSDQPELLARPAGVQVRQGDAQAQAPDVQIVGDDFSPLAQVRDFAPYVAKIKQSGADT
jgi:branched-chain amino acid transport system substrate-binding protein